MAVVSARDLRKKFGSSNVLDGIDFEMQAAERLVLLGPSGAGKSTLAKCLAGWERADSGEITYARRPQLVPQNPGDSLNPEFTAYEVLAEPDRLRNTPVRAVQWMEAVGLPSEISYRRSRACSGGEKARLSIARALAYCEGSEVLLIFDESFEGLDFVSRAQIVDLLMRLQQKWPLSYLLITHDLWLARRFACETAEIKEGKLVRG